MSQNYFYKPYLSDPESSSDDSSSDESDSFSPLSDKRDTNKTNTGLGAVGSLTSVTGFPAKLQANAPALPLPPVADPKVPTM